MIDCFLNSSYLTTLVMRSMNKRIFVSLLSLLVSLIQGNQSISLLLTENDVPHSRGSSSLSHVQYNNTIKDNLRNSVSKRKASTNNELGDSKLTGSANINGEAPSNGNIKMFPDDARQLKHSDQSIVKSSAVVEFVPYPHQRIFDGYLEEGVWVAGDLSFMAERLNQNFDSLDSIQSNAIKDGIFFPSQRDFPKFHIFSASEAGSCFEGKNIFVSGDSYMMQMFIGLADILLNRPHNEEIKNGKHREDILVSSEESLKLLFGKKTSVKFLYYQCHLNDFTCLNGIMIDDETWKTGDAFITSVAIHYKGLHILDPLLVDHYGMEVGHFFQTAKEKKLSWVTGVSYRKPYNQSVVQINFKAYEEAKKAQVPLLDIFTMSEMCVLANCSTEGGHKSRYVNRMKAQFLLNNLCSIRLVV